MGPKRIITILTVFLIIFIVAPSAVTSEVEVIIKANQDDVVFTYQPYDDRKLIIHGTVSCDIKDSWDEIEHVDVELYFSDNLYWDGYIHDSYLRFYTNGTQDFTLELEIPDDIHNGTENIITFSGWWELKVTNTKLILDYGKTNYDYVHVTIIRISNGTSGGSGTLNDDLTPAPWYEVFLPYIIGVSILIIVAIVIIVLFYRKRKKELLEFLAENAE